MTVFRWDGETTETWTVTNDPTPTFHREGDDVVCSCSWRDGPMRTRADRIVGFVRNVEDFAYFRPPATIRDIRGIR